MKQEDYMKAILERVNADHSTTCEDCGRKTIVSHAIVDHEACSVKVVCHDCFIIRYQAGLYGKEYRA
jgi:hypothetical protein